MCNKITCRLKFLKTQIVHALPQVSNNLELQFKSSRGGPVVKDTDKANLGSCEVTQTQVRIPAREVLYSVPTRTIEQRNMVGARTKIIYI